MWGNITLQFWFVFPWWLVMVNTLYEPISHLYVGFGKMSAHVHFPFFNHIFWFLLLSYMSLLYILDINPLPNIRFANIFSHLVCCLFYMSVFMTIPYCFDYYSFVIILIVESMMSPALFFFSKTVWAIQSLLWFHQNFRNVCSFSVKNTMKNLIGIALKL